MGIVEGKDIVSGELTVESDDVHSGGFDDVVEDRDVGVGEKVVGVVMIMACVEDVALNDVST